MVGLEKAVLINQRNRLIGKKALRLNTDINHFDLNIIVSYTKMAKMR